MISLRSATAALNLYRKKVSKYGAGDNGWTRACHWRCNLILWTRRRLTAVVTRQECVEQLIYRRDEIQFLPVINYRRVDGQNAADGAPRRSPRGTR